VFHRRLGLYFSIVRAQRLVLETDTAFTWVMLKLQSYKARVALNFEVMLLPGLLVYGFLAMNIFVFYDSSYIVQMCLK
jgi:hypothetical protein